MADPTDFSDLVSPSAPSGDQNAPNFSDLTTSTAPTGTQPNLVVNPNLVTPQHWAGNPVSDMQAAGYEMGKGATFGLLDKIAPESVQQNASQFEQEHPEGAKTAQFVGSLIPGAATMAIPGMGPEATIAQRALVNAGVGAAAGATQNAAESPGDWRANAITGAVTGGGAGLVLGGLAGNIAPPIRSIVSGGNADYVGNRASALIASKIAQDAEYGSPGAAQLADALDRADKLGVPSGAVDLGGENLQSFAGNLYRSPGAPRAALSNYFTQRDLGATSRLMDAIDSSVATGSKTSDEAIQEQLQARSQAAAPLYDALYKRYPVVSSDRINQFVADPIVQQGLATGIKLQRLEALASGTPFDPQAYTVTFNAAGDPVWTGTPNLRTLDAAKRGLDDMLSGDTYRNQYGQLTQMGNAINGVRKAYVNELDSLTGGPSGAYAQARAAWAGPSRAMEMVKEGGKWMSKDPGQLSRDISNLSPSDKDYYLLGVANNMRNAVLGQKGGGNEANQILNSPAAKMRAQALFAPDVYDDLVNKVEGERQAFQTYSKVAKGSQTQARNVEDTSNSGHGGGNSLVAPLVIMGAEHNPWLAAGYGAWKGAKGIYNWAMQPSPAVKARAAEMLTGSTPEQAATMRGIAGMSTAGPRAIPMATPGIAGALGTVPGEFFRQPVPTQARGGIIGTA